GQMITELDAIPVDGGEKVANAVFPKVTQLVRIVTNSLITQEQKLIIFEQLNILKNNVTDYQAAVEKGTALRNDRIDALTKVESLTKKLIETQARNIMNFGSVLQPELVHALIGSAAFILAALLWLFGMSGRFSRVVAGDAKRIRETLEKWRTQGTAPETNSNIKYGDFGSIFDEIKKLNESLEKKNEAEDCLRTHGVTPQVVVNTKKNAVLWNSAFSGLAKQRSFDELGAVSYSRLLRFTDGRTQPVDPVEKCMIDGKEVSQLCMLRVGSELVPTYVQCTPVFESADVISNVVVELRDLRAEQRRIETEIERQVSFIESALDAIKEGRVPEEGAIGAKQSIISFIGKLRQFALREQEKHEVLIGQIELLWTRVEKEADLGRRTIDQVDGVRSQVVTLGSTLKEVCEQAKNLRWMQEKSGVITGDVQKRMDSLRRQFETLATEMNRSKRMLTGATTSLSKSQTILSKVRVLQHAIESILKRSSVLNANNAILGAQTLSANDVVSISENISEVLHQFERGYTQLSNVVTLLERGFKDSNERVLQDLQVCLRIIGDDEQLIREVKGLEQAHEKSFEDLARVFATAKTLEGAAVRTAEALTNVAQTTEALAQLGQTSQDLHTQVEEGLRGVLGHFSEEFRRNSK
ncbi:MAG TPA: hypothetical protein PLH57_06890, partial [Oligoflexia bacterium]|nr:hypothetical protein [Oligoflexia bacterium]